MTKGRKHKTSLVKTRKEEENRRKQGLLGKLVLSLSSCLVQKCSFHGTILLLFVSIVGFGIDEREITKGRQLPLNALIYTLFNFRATVEGYLRSSEKLGKITFTAFFPQVKSLLLFSTAQLPVLALML